MVPPSWADPVPGQGEPGLRSTVASRPIGNGTQVVFTVPTGQTLQVTDILVENSAGDTGTLALARSGTP